MNKEELRTQKITFWWRWWDEAEHKSTPEKRLAFYDALMRYIFTGAIPPDPVEIGDPDGVAWAAYDATHYFDVIDNAVGGPAQEIIHTAVRARKGGQPGNRNAAKKVVNNSVDNRARENESKTNKNESETNKETNSTEKHYQSETNKNESKTNLRIRSSGNIEESSFYIDNTESYNDDTETNKNESKTNEKTNKNESKTNALKNKEIRNKNNTPHTPLQGGGALDEFERFWKEYPSSCPRKVDKAKCRKKFEALFRSAPDKMKLMSDIMCGLKRWKASCDWNKNNGEFIRAPLVWLNNASWNDDPKPADGMVSVEIQEQERKYLRSDWQLCDERCSQIVSGICACGYSVPPQLRDGRPIPPEECSGFIQKEPRTEQGDLKLE